MNCEKCGQQLNNWNAFCPNCGEKAPETISNEQTQTTRKQAVVRASFIWLSLVCWGAMGILSPFNFRWNQWDNLPLSEMLFIYPASVVLINIACAVFLIAGALLLLKTNRKEIIVLGMGLYIVGDVAKLFYGILVHSIYDLLSPVLMAVVVISFFVFIRRQMDMKKLFLVCVVCTSILIFAPVLGMGGASMLTSSEVLRDVLFFGGAVFLSLQMKEMQKAGVL